MEFHERSEGFKQFLKERFSTHGIDAEEAYNHDNIFQDEVRGLSDDELVTFLAHKDISHIYPVSTHPELKSDINNIVLEDSSVNRSRGAEVMTDKEFNNTLEDNIQDAEIIDDANGIEIEEVLGDVLPGLGIVAAGAATYYGWKKWKEKKPDLNPVEKVKSYIVQVGKKRVGLMAVGTAAASGVPILVAPAFAYYLYKGKLSAEQVNKVIKRNNEISRQEKQVILDKWIDVSNKLSNVSGTTVSVSQAIRIMNLKFSEILHQSNSTLDQLRAKYKKYNDEKITLQNESKRLSNENWKLLDEM